MDKYDEDIAFYKENISDPQWQDELIRCVEVEREHDRRVQSEAIKPIPPKVPLPEPSDIEPMKIPRVGFLPVIPPAILQKVRLYLGKK